MLPLLSMLAKGGDPAWFFIVILAGFVGGVIAIMMHGQARDRRTALALRLGGRYESGGLFSAPAIHFRVSDRPAMLEFQGGKGACTRLTVPLPASSAGTLKITSVQFGWELLRLIGYDSVRIGDPSFDASYAVTGNRDLILRVFSLENRLRVMEAVRRIAVYPGFSLELDTGSLRLRFDGTLDEEVFARTVRRTAEAFVSLVFGPPPVVGIEWGESVERPTGLCPICTTVLKEPVTRCLRCRAPHHRECWEYLGRCAVYGCEPKPGRRAA
jgi:hypothetical protein